jgi:21S rRNA (GM2251-2'-O)-methyltransferase
MAGGRKHFKLKKALQKIQEREEEDEGGRKTRSKRFNDPNFSFGKKSLVYQLNKGDFKEKIGKLVDDRRARVESPEKRGGSEERDSKPGKSAWESRDKPPSPGRGAWDSMDKASVPGRDSRPARTSWDRPDRPERRDRQDRSSSASYYQPAAEGERRKPRSFSEDPRSPRVRRELEEGSEDQPRPQRSRSHEGLPSTLPYTTAASQFLFGRWPVMAALKEANRKLYNLYIYEGSNKREAMDAVRALAEKRGVKVTSIPESKQQLLDSLSKGRPHQGLVLEASPLPQLPINGLGPVADGGFTVEISHQSKEDLAINGAEPFQRWSSRSGHQPLVLLLHEVMDPGNLGAILRTARFLGAAAVAITKQTSSPITPTVVKAAAGAAEELTIFSVADPASFLETSKKAGWASYVAVAPTSSKGSRQQSTPEDIAEEDPLSEKPCILVMGNEGEGLSRRITSKANHQVTIMREASSSASSVDSLNVSVAAALLCDAFTKGARRMPSSFEDKLKEDAKKARSGPSMF